MILNRILPKIDCHLRTNQNGFRSGKSTTTHIVALRRMIEEVKKWNKKAILLYVDFRKAFDSIHREKVFEILKAYDILLLKAIETTYTNTIAKGNYAGWRN